MNLAIADRMRSSNLNTKLPNELGSMLRDWRAARGRSQYDLSLDTGVSQRHISFVESGRSVPRRQTLLEIAEALDVPLRDRNALLLAAGYAPVYSDGAWDAPEMRSVTAALTRTLRQHEPFPAVVMDRYWNVLTTNEVNAALFQFFHRHGGAQGTAQRVASDVESSRECGPSSRTGKMRPRVCFSASTAKIGRARS